MSLLLASVLASALSATPASVDPRLSILDAMKEELERNRTRLKLGENPAALLHQLPGEGH